MLFKIINFKDLLAWICKCIITFFTVILVLLEVSHYTKRHPVSAHVSYKTTGLNHQPAVTVCRWPPFATSLNNTEDLGRMWNTEGDVYENLYIEVYCRNGSVLEEYFFISTILGNCSLILPECVYNFVKIYSTFNSKRIFISVHSRNNPPFVKNAIEFYQWHKLNVNVTFGQYYNLEYKNIVTPDNCIYKCHQKHFMENNGCAPPFILWHTEYPICSMEQLSNYPLILPMKYSEDDKINSIPDIPFNYKDLIPSMSNITFNSKAGLMNHIKNKCLKLCSYAHHDVYSVNIDQFKGSSSSEATITANYGEIPVVTEEDWMTLAQLISNLGGIISFTQGISLLSLLEFTATYFSFMLGFKG